MVLLDDELEIALADNEALESLSGFRKGSDPPDRLPSALATALRDVQAGWDEKRLPDSVVLEIGETVFRIARLTGPSGCFVCVSIETHRKPYHMRAAADRYGFTRRQQDVLACLCRGLSSRQIAQELCISETTVADHIQALLSKSGSRSRADMLVRIFADSTSRGKT